MIPKVDWSNRRTLVLKLEIHLQNIQEGCGHSCNHPAKKIPKTKCSYFWNSDFRVPELQKQSKMVICFVNLSEFQYQSEI